jgi:hypothetical protein
MFGGGGFSMDPRLVGSWRLEGVSTLLGRPEPDASDEVWKANRAGPKHRAALRGVGYVFRSDGTGAIESRRDPPLRFSDSFTWRVEEEDGRRYLVLSGPDGATGHLRYWIRADRQKMLCSMYPAAPDPPVASLLVREDPPLVGRKAQPRRTTRRT